MSESSSTRADRRRFDELRPVSFVRGFTRYAEGSVLVSFGDTRVLCNATVEEAVPAFLKGKGSGWVTGEYAMLPRATQTRSARESLRGKVGGRTYEIQRLIGRSLRAVTDLAALGERTLVLDCDVLQADGGTRTAAITGACVALTEAFDGLVSRGVLPATPLRERVSAISVGMVAGRVLLDLDYREDAAAEVDANFVVTESGLLVEVQGTAEERPFTVQQLDQMRDLALQGCRQLNRLQSQCLGE